MRVSSLKVLQASKAFQKTVKSTIYYDFELPMGFSLLTKHVKKINVFLIPLYDRKYRLRNKYDVLSFILHTCGLWNWWQSDNENGKYYKQCNNTVMYEFIWIHRTCAYIYFECLL